jgi:hypothetical protein
MTPPSSDVICYRPAGDGAGEKCGYVVQQINYCRWFGDQTYHLCNLTLPRRPVPGEQPSTAAACPAGRSTTTARWRRGTDVTRRLAAANTTRQHELLSTTIHRASTHNDASAIRQTSRACVPYSALAEPTASQRRRRSVTY